MIELPLTRESPAKLNLFLHITGRRSDGYHTLQTVFQLIDLCDVLTFEVNPDAPPGLLSLRCDEPGVPRDNNLVMQAARGLREAVNNPDLGISVHLKKNIPQGAGLGGGSSNAATTLLALNELWNTGLSVTQLCDIGIGLGADVPLFVQGKSAWATGIGDELEPLELAPANYLIIWPRIAVSTALIFSQENLTRDSSAIKIADFLAGGGRNDCEPVVRQLYPEVNEALEWLARHGDARLTGTGSCVFTRFETVPSAQAVLDQMPNKFQGYIVKGLNRFPA